MVTAKCNRCFGSATGKSFDEASLNIDHAVGLSRGIPCGRNYDCVVEIKESKDDFKKVEKKSVKTITLDELKTLKKPKTTKQ